MNRMLRLDIEISNETKINFDVRNTLYSAIYHLQALMSEGFVRRYYEAYRRYYTTRQELIIA